MKSVSSIGPCGRDCFECPYSDCIMDSTTNAEKAASTAIDAEILAERARTRQARWYWKNRESVREKEREKYRKRRNHDSF